MYRYMAQITTLIIPTYLVSCHNFRQNCCYYLAWQCIHLLNLLAPISINELIQSFKTSLCFCWHYLKWSNSNAMKYKFILLINNKTFGHVSHQVPQICSSVHPCSHNEICNITIKKYITSGQIIASLSWNIFDLVLSFKVACVSMF